MLVTYLRRLFVGATICALGGAIATGVACSSAPRKVPGTGGTGSAGTTGTSGTTGTAGTSSTGTAGTSGGAGDTSTGTAGTTSVSGTAGTSGGAGDTGAGTAGTGAGTAGAGTAGTSGTAGDTGGGTAGTAAPDVSITTSALPVAVTAYWYPSGWGGDANTVAAFTAATPPIKVEDQTTPTAATTGPCAKRAAGAVGDCFKVTYTPVGTGGNAYVALIPAMPTGPMVGKPSFDATVAPHVPAGATKITARVAGDVGGEAVTFNLWTTDSGNLFMPTLAAGQVWQQISLPLVGVTYDKVQSPFGWSSASATPIVFYYDDIKIDNAP